MPVTINGTTGIATPDGSASVPPYTGSSGATNGLYFPSATTAAITTNGTQALYISSSQQVGIGTASPAGPLTISYSTNGFFNTGLSVVNTNSGATAGSCIQITNDAGNRAGFYNMSSTCPYYGGANTAAIGTVDSNSFSFITGNTVRATLGTTGNLTFNTADAGIVFNKSGALTNSTLNDYEAGTWTPTNNGASSITITNQNTPTYTRIGRMVTVNAFISISSNSTNTVLQIGGLPYAAATYFAGPIGYNTNGTYLDRSCLIESGSTYVTIRDPSTSRNWITYSGVSIIFTATYFV